MPPDVDLRQRNTVGDSALFRANAGILGATPSSDLNPLYQAANQRRNDERERIQGSFRGRFRFTDWLTLEGSYGFDRFGSEFRFFDPRGRLQQNLTEFAGAVNINNVGTTAQNAQAILSATRRTGRLNTILRASVLTEDERNTNQFAGGVNLSAVGVPTLDNTAPQGRQISNFDSRLRARNFFLQGTVDWADKLGLDVLGRRDGSSLFGSDTRWRNFYRVAGFYRLSQDVRIPGIDEFKLRAARGTAGLRPPFFAQYETFTNTNGVISFGVLGSRDLRPAYSTETEVGFNIDFLRRFSLEYTYANKVTQDQVLPVPLSATNGFTTQWRNAGTLEGNTHEALFRTILVDRPGLSWQANITFDRTRQRTTALNSVCFRTGAGSLQANGTNATLQSNDLFFVCPGVDFGAMYGSRWVRSYEELSERPGFDPAANPASNYVVNPDGLLVLASTRGTADERAIRYVNAAGSSNVQIGTSIPDFQLGFNTSFTWKGLSVFGLLDWSQGGNIYNLPRQWLARQEFRSADLDQAGKPQDQRLASAYYAAINDANNFSDYFVEDGSFARLRELSVNYTLTPSQLGFFRLDRVTQRVRLGLIGRNLLTWTRYTGLDPEASAVGTSAGTGAISGQGGLGAAGDATTFRLDNFGYPNFRTFSFLVELGF
ncbi:MAG: TonB-dependent receptor [Gemmatimonadaceae bacterium]|nr:TonB-dependent receptor [Gemmatimonadaceae bacterium]